jgi:hypothetical protein
VADGDDDRERPIDQINRRYRRESCVVRQKLGRRDRHPPPDEGHGDPRLVEPFRGGPKSISFLAQVHVR